MAGMRRGGAGRFSAIIWPGFVDAMAGLLMIVMFVLTVFVVVQSVMRDRITSQDQRLEQMGAQVAQLGRALGLARDERTILRDEGAALRDRLAEEAAARAAEAEAASARIAAQRTEIDAGTEAARLAAARREALEALIADLRRRNAEAGTQAQNLAARLDSAQAERAVLTDSLASAQAEQAALTDRLTTTQAEQADLNTRLVAAQDRQAALSQRLSDEEAARLVEAAAAQALRERLTQADATLDARTLALEAARKEAEDTLTLLAAAESARDEAQAAAQSAERAGQDEAARQAALLSLAQRRLSEQEELTVEDQRQVAALNAQLGELRNRLAQLQTVLDASTEQGAQAELRLDDLGAQLNAALLRAATLDSERAKAESDRAQAESERAEAEAARAEAEAARAEAEAEARARAEAEALDLARYRSEFFGQLSGILQGREGVEVVGDRFVFSSEVLFSPGEAILSPQGRDQIRAVTEMLDGVAAQIPPGIDWVIRVDGHTDDQPLSGTGRYRDNWELSQARALAVVRYMVGDLGFAPDRLVAAGFGEFRPAMAGDSPQARAANRRIELKLTER